MRLTVAFVGIVSFFALGALAAPPPPPPPPSTATPHPPPSPPVTHSPPPPPVTPSPPPPITPTPTVSVPASTTTTTTYYPTTTIYAEHWRQCGGLGWAGPTVCEPPYECFFWNDWHSQCL